jgi:ABC-2 type transport system permease protein
MAITTIPSHHTGHLTGSVWQLTRRALLRFVRTPQLIVLAIVQMSLFFLIFRYMFGGAIHVLALPYVDFLAPGFIATGVLFSGIGSATAMAEDLEQGFIDRLRSLPIPRASVLVARAVADTIILTFSAALTVAIASSWGFACTSVCSMGWQRLVWWCSSGSSSSGSLSPWDCSRATRRRHRAWG